MSMSEEVQYAVVDFSTSHFSPRPKSKDEDIVYANVKAPSALGTQAPVADTPSCDAEREEPASVVAASPQKNKPSHRAQRLVALLSLLSALLLVASTILSTFFFLHISALQQLRDNVSSLTTANRDLDAFNGNLTEQLYNVTSEKAVLESEKRETEMEKELLTQWIVGIMRFKNFPVELYCPYNQNVTKGRACQSCPVGWTQFNTKCYYAYVGEVWKSWQESRMECLKMGGDLLTIESAEEQVRRRWCHLKRGPVLIVGASAEIHSQPRSYLLRHVARILDGTVRKWAGMDMAKRHGTERRPLEYESIWNVCVNKHGLGGVKELEGSLLFDEEPMDL